MTDTQGNSVEYTVNGNGYTSGNTDAMGYVSSTEYNDMNRPISITDREGNTTLTNTTKSAVLLRLQTRSATGYVPKESPPVEYEHLMKRLTEVYTKLMVGNYSSDAAELRQIILQLQAALTLPEKII
jgi:YD repeat-containing protein